MRARGGRRSVLSEQPAGNDTLASAERAGSVALAGGDDAFARGELAPDEHAVFRVTGSGFMDERSLLRMTGEAPPPLVGSFDEYAKAVRAELAV